METSSLYIVSGFGTQGGSFLSYSFGFLFGVRAFETESRILLTDTPG